MRPASNLSRPKVFGSTGGGVDPGRRQPIRPCRPVERQDEVSGANALRSKVQTINREFVEPSVVTAGRFQAEEPFGIPDISRQSAREAVVHAVRMSRTGGPEVLEWVEVPDPKPGDGQALVAVEAVGVNFLEIYRRTGLYQIPLPAVPGSELAGTVLAVGPGAGGIAVGDRVATVDAPGAYAEQAVVPVDRLVPIPDPVSCEDAAAAMVQGMTAQYLVTDTFLLEPGQRCLVHAAAGGVGLLLVQLAHQVGAEVFATVGSSAKAELARSAGADHVIVPAEQEFVAAVEAIAGPRPLDVVYDGVGKDTFAGGLSLLRRRGMMVTFGNASGAVDPISPLVLMSNGSLFLTRPLLFDYIASSSDLHARAEDVLSRIADGTLAMRIGARYPLAQAAQAHSLLESRQSTGKIILGVARDS